MTKLDHFWVIHTTSTTANADTEDTFSLGLLSTQPNPSFEIWLPFPLLPHDERERGRTDQYRFNIVESETTISMELLRARNLAIRTNGSDAWLPSSIWVLGQDVSGTRRLLAGVPNWPRSLWFSKDPPKEKISIPWATLLSNFVCPNAGQCCIDRTRSAQMLSFARLAMWMGRSPGQSRYYPTIAPY